MLQHLKFILPLTPLHTLFSLRLCLYFCLKEVLLVQYKVCQTLGAAYLISCVLKQKLSPGLVIS